MDDTKNILRDSYEKKYFDESPEALNSLVAPQTSGAKILDMFHFEKKGDIYPEFENKKVTDIWWWFSSLVFELSPSVQEITIVDPIFAYDRKTQLIKEETRAENRMKIFETLKIDSPEDILMLRKKNKESSQEVLDGIKEWRDYAVDTYKNICLNTSLAQHIEWIEEESQDIVFLNFVLDKLQGNESKEKEILTALDNAYRISKIWGKIYGIHDKVRSEDEIVHALEKTKYERKREDKERYMIFIIDKKQ